MEFVGGTYVSQVNAPSEKSACVKWAQSIKLSEIPGLGRNGKESLVKQMKDESPVALTNTVNAWCTGALIHGEHALINVVRTERNSNGVSRKANRRAAA